MSSLLNLQGKDLRNKYRKDCMAIVLYGNGLTEEIIPTNLTFSDQEILNRFQDFNNIKTKRLDEVPNTWCVWGELQSPNEDDYNKLASEVIREHCYSHLILLHDTEVDPSWNLTDSIIYENYAIFKRKLLKFLDEVAIETIREIEHIRESSGKPNLMSLDQVAISVDKRVIFKFNPDKQQVDFFKPSHFEEFANKCFNFLDKYYKDGDTLPIYADKKMIIVLDDNQVAQFINLLIDFFEKREDYLKCARIRDIHKSWLAFKAKKNPPKKRGRPPKKKEDDPPKS
jgi:hypothetical protein